MGDKQNAARVAWATVKLSQVGQRPIWRERAELRDGIVRLDATPAGPRRHQVHTSGRPMPATPLL